MLVGAELAPPNLIRVEQARPLRCYCYHFFVTPRNEKIKPRSSKKGSRGGISALPKA